MIAFCERRPSPYYVFREISCAYFCCEVYHLQLFYFREEFFYLECYQKVTLCIRNSINHLISISLTISTATQKHIRHHYSRRRYRRNFCRNTGRKYGSKRTSCRAVYMDRRTGNSSRSQHDGRHEPTEERNIPRLHYAHSELLRLTREIYGYMLLGLTESCV